MNNNKDVHFTTEIFKDQESAEKAYQEAIKAGYTPQDINVMMSEDSKNKYYNSILVKEGLVCTSEGFCDNLVPFTIK